MAELQPPDSAQLNGNGLTPTAATVSAGSLLPGGAAAGVASTALQAMTSSETVGSKRQRRPSVRLGDLGGDQTYDSVSRRAPRPWKNQSHHHNHHSHNHNQSSSLSVENRLGRETGAKSSSKTRPLVNFSETLESEERDREGNLEAMAIGSWKHKESSKKQRGGFAATKRVRSNWASSKHADGEEKYSGGEDVENDDGDGGDDGGGGENSDSPVDSMDERENLYNNNNASRRQIRGARVSVDQHNHHDGVELLSGPSDTEAREWNSGGGGGGGGGGGVGEDGVRVWLNGLGLGRYAPVFEIHEVDDEVLPMLTLEDLKDMGINAVGSRRKMFCAIQKLGKGFS